MSTAFMATPEIKEELDGEPMVLLTRKEKRLIDKMLMQENEKEEIKTAPI